MSSHGLTEDEAYQDELLEVVQTALTSEGVTPDQALMAMIAVELRTIRAMLESREDEGEDWK